MPAVITAIALDLGTTSIKAGLLSEDGTLGGVLARAGTGRPLARSQIRNEERWLHKPSGGRAIVCARHSASTASAATAYASASLS